MKINYTNANMDNKLFVNQRSPMGSETVGFFAILCLSHGALIMFPIDLCGLYNDSVGKAMGMYLFLKVMVFA